VAARRITPRVDLAAIQDELGDELEEAVLEVIRSRRFIGGDKVTEFERAFADFMGAADAIGVANDTDAIELSLKALSLASGPGDHGDRSWRPGLLVQTGDADSGAGEEGDEEHRPRARGRRCSRGY
jgi:hypothetical protein